jgi:molybdenum cofactor biosynthesis protein MoaC
MTSAPASIRLYSTKGKHPFDNVDKAPNSNLTQSKEQHQSWSSYMGTEEDGDDSPWASLDAFADGAKHLARPSSTSEPRVLEPRKALQEQSSWEEAAIAAADLYASSTVSPTDTPAAPRLTHIDPMNNSPSMVDVSSKATTTRTAKAEAKVYISNAIVRLLQGESLSDGEETKYKEKGPVLQTAQLAGIMGAKRTSELIPLCHGLNLSHVDVQIDMIAALQPYLHVVCTAKTSSQTGVEMEALTGASIASLTLWDMLKSIGGKEMRIDGLMVTSKQGGKSGDWQRR